MPLPSPAQAPSQPIVTRAEPSPVLLIGITIGVVILAGTTMALTILFLWRRFQRGRGPSPQDEEAPAETKEQGIFAYRKPVVIIDPNEDISYGRKESSYFPSFFKLGPKPSQDHVETELPEPADGGYYSKGEPVLFEVDLDTEQTHAEACQRDPHDPPAQ